jgi:hypothetical protein
MSSFKLMWSRSGLSSKHTALNFFISKLPCPRNLTRAAPLSNRELTICLGCTTGSRVEFVMEVLQEEYAPPVLKELEIRTRAGHPAVS